MAVFEKEWENSVSIHSRNYTWKSIVIWLQQIHSGSLSWQIYGDGGVNNLFTKSLRPSLKKLSCDTLEQKDRATEFLEETISQWRKNKERLEKYFPLIRQLPWLNCVDQLDQQSQVFI